MFFYTDGKILIHGGNNYDHLSEAVERIVEHCVTIEGLEVEFEENEDVDFPAFHVPNGVTYDIMDKALRPNLALRAINEDILISPETQNINVKYNYSDEELKEIGEKLSQAVLDKHKVEAAKKRVMADFKKQIEDVEGLIDRYAEAHAQGYEYRDYKAHVKYNFADKMKYYVDNNEPETIRKTEPMEPKDYQLRIDHTKESRYAGEIAPSMVVHDDEEDDLPV